MIACHLYNTLRLIANTRFIIMDKFLCFELILPRHVFNYLIPGTNSRPLADIQVHLSFMLSGEVIVASLYG
jgi:hypothetical protein